MVIAEPVTDAGAGDSIYPRQSDKIKDDSTGTPPSSSKEEEVSCMPLYKLLDACSKLQPLLSQISNAQHALNSQVK